MTALLRSRARALALATLLLAPVRARAELPTAPVEVRGPATQLVGVLEAPAVTGDQYAIRGNVAYEGVEGVGYIEMWSVFPDGGRYFSRTLGESGPMGKLHGTSAVRPFVLPFLLTPEAARPVRLEVNVVLPAGGRVTLSDLAFASGPSAMATPGAWWSGPSSGLLGGMLGGGVGVLGAVIGTLCSMGRARRFVMVGLLAIGAKGLLLLGAGGLALALGQPYEVWYPLLLMGVLAPALGFGLLPTARRRYEALELRRMQAMDVP
jgi:hypothetical protein